MLQDEMSEYKREDLLGKKQAEQNTNRLESKTIISHIKKECIRLDATGESPLLEEVLIRERSRIAATDSNLLCILSDTATSKQLFGNTETGTATNSLRISTDSASTTIGTKMDGVATSISFQPAEQQQQMLRTTTSSFEMIETINAHHAEHTCTNAFGNVSTTNAGVCQQEIQPYCHSFASDKTTSNAPPPPTVCVSPQFSSGAGKTVMPDTTLTATHELSIVALNQLQYDTEASQSAHLMSSEVNKVLSPRYASRSTVTDATRVENMDERKNSVALCEESSVFNMGSSANADTLTVATTADLDTIIGENDVMDTSAATQITGSEGKHILDTKADMDSSDSNMPGLEEVSESSSNESDTDEARDAAMLAAQKTALPTKTSARAKKKKVNRKSKKNYYRKQSNWLK